MISKGQALKMKAFIASLSESEDELGDWNERIWMLLIEGQQYIKTQVLHST